MSNWAYDVPFVGVAQVQIVKGWEDYETGWNFIGEAVSKDLIKYIKENGNEEEKQIFFSQFEVKKLRTLSSQPDVNAAREFWKRLSIEEERQFYVHYTTGEGKGIFPGIDENTSFNDYLVYTWKQTEYERIHDI